MTRVISNISTSLDGYVAGPNDSRENPLGDGGERITGWMFDLASWCEQQEASCCGVLFDYQVFSKPLVSIPADCLRLLDLGPATKSARPASVYTSPRHIP